MLERRQVHSHIRAKYKKTKACIMVTKPCSSEEKEEEEQTKGPIRLFKKKLFSHKVVHIHNIYWYSEYHINKAKAISAKLLDLNLKN